LQLETLYTSVVTGNYPFYLVFNSISFSAALILVLKVWSFDVIFSLPISFGLLTNLLKLRNLSKLSISACFDNNAMRRAKPCQARRWQPNCRDQVQEHAPSELGHHEVMAG
jgi:hypothetical protein